MVLLSSARTIIVDGVTVLPDHASKDQFWYLPAPVALARRGPEKDAQFTLILYKPGTVVPGVQGGGFLMFEAGLALDPTTERKILAKLSTLSRKPQLNIVPFDEGTVECIALNIQGAGGTNAEPAIPGTFNAVQTVLGAKSPSLHGTNAAAFSLRLSQEGAIILREAFQKEGAPVGVLYALKFTALQPAMEIKITANMKRVYEHFSAGLNANVYFVSAGVQIGLEKLKESKDITIEVTHFTTDADRAQKEAAALLLFKELVLTDLFKPALTPGSLMGGAAKPGDGGTKPGDGGTQPGDGGTKPGDGGTQPGDGGTKPPDGGTQPGDGGTKPPDGGTQPGDGGTKPPDGGTQPGDGGTKPPDGGTQPGDGGTKPPDGGTQPGGTQPGGTPPGGTPPGGTQPADGGTQPGGGSGPGPSLRVADTRAASGPIDSGPVSPGSPGGTQPGGTPPGGTQPGGTEPGGTQPGGTQPGGTQPGGTQPGGTQPGDGGTIPGVGGGGAAAPASPVSISFQLKFIKQEELKTAVLKYNSQQAVQRSYNPQGFIGLMTKDLDKSKHFIEVDLDSPFFRQMAVTVDAPIDFAKIGLHSAQVALDYGNPADPTTHRHKDMVFDTAHTGEQAWEFFLNRTLDTQFAYDVQYHFDPGSGWEGEALSYDFGQRRGEDRTLYVNPFEQLRFSEYTVSPRGIDFGIVDFTEVSLRYEPPAGPPVTKTLLLREGGEPQVWKLRTPVAVLPTIRYRARHHLKDGSERDGAEATTERTAILVDDPFPEALEVVFFPFFDAALVRKVFVDVEYKDPDNHYERKERLEIPGTAVDEIRFRIALINPAKRKFKYQMTLIKTTGIVQKPPVETDQSIISLSE